MKERWQLIQLGQNKKDIKIRGNKILLKGNLYGTVIESKFAHNSQPIIVNPKAANTPAGDPLTMDIGTSEN